MGNKGNLFNQTKAKNGIADNEKDVGIANKSGASVITKENGNIDISAGKYTQIKLDKQTSTVLKQSLSSVSTSVVEEFVFADLVMNKHKFNNKLIELSDIRSINDKLTMGGLLMNGTVLVKTWNDNLNKWVLVRRPISQSMFSSRLNIPSVPKPFEIDLSMEEDITKYYTNKED